MIEKIPFVLVNQSGEKIVGDLRSAEGGKKKPVILVLHSFMAFKDWGWVPHVAETIAAAGFAVVTFNFSRGGVNKNPNRITEFKIFQQNTISHEINDVQSVLEGIRRGEIGSEITDPNNIILLGHSRGGV